MIKDNKPAMKRKKGIKIQFGSGGKIKKDHINVDLDKRQGADVCCDMEKFPYPFPDNYADEILCEMTLEHIRTPTKAIDEFHRIVKPEGTVKIIVPHFSHAYSLFADIHISTFNTGYFWSRKNEDVDGWGNKLTNTGWWFFDKDCRWKEVEVKLIFPQGKMKIISLPFQLVFGKKKRLQAIYEHFFSTMYRACEIHVTLKNKP